MNHSKQKGTKSCAEWRFWALTAQPLFPYSRSIFYNFHKNKVLNFFVFFYPRGSVRSPDAKRTQILGPGMLV